MNIEKLRFVFQKHKFEKIEKIISRKKLGLILKLLVSIILFFLISRKIDIFAFKKLILNLDIIFFIIAVINFTIQVPIVGARWLKIIGLISNSPVEQLSTNVQAANASATFLGQVLPGPAADAFRFFWLHKLGLSFTQAGLSVFMDRVLALYVFLFMSIIILIFVGIELNLNELVVLFVMSFLALIFFSILLFFIPISLSKKFSKWPRINHFIHALLEVKVLLASKKGILLLFMCFLVHLMTILSIFVLGLSLHINLSIFGAAVFMVSMVLATIIPISVGGWGIREFAAVSIAGVIPGLTTEGATAISVLFGLMMLFGSLAPLIYWRKQLPLRTLWNYSR